MNGTMPATAQLIMKRADGTSILDLQGEQVTAASPSLTKGDVGEARAAEIHSKLQRLGFSIEAGNLNTLSISGPAELFVEHFGFDPQAAQSAGVPAHANKVTPDLESYVADVFVAPGPEMFE